MKKSRFSKLLGYFYIPVIFCIIGYLILGIALRPVWEMAYDTFGMLSAENAPNFNPELTSIFDPSAADDNPVTVYVEEPEEEQIITYEYISAENIEAPEEEEALQEHYLYIEYAEGDAFGTGDASADVVGTAADVTDGDIEDAEAASDRQLAYIYASDEEVEDLADARRIAFAYVEKDEQGREAAYIYLTDQMHLLYPRIRRILLRLIWMKWVWKISSQVSRSSIWRKMPEMLSTLFLQQMQRM